MAGKKRKSAEMGRVDVPARREPRRGLGVAALESIRAQLETAESFYMFMSLATAAATAAPPLTPPLTSLLAGHVGGVRFDPYVGNGAGQRDYYPHYFGAEQSNTTPWHAVNISTSSKIVRLLRDASALHMRIASPPVVGSCLYGIDTPSDGELISNRMDLEGMRREIGSDSLAFLSLDKLHGIYGEEAGDYCDACFSRKYPVLPTLLEPAAEFDEEE